ncbi:MAG: hypothetical protein AB8G22_24920 [Saprospiraceae bacterium]
MKKYTFLLLFIFLIVENALLYAQNNEYAPTVAVLDIDTEGFTQTPSEMGNLVRLELSKLEQLEVMDRYDVAYLLNKVQFDNQDCFGKICLIEAGKTLKVDKMLTGNVSLINETVNINLRLIDVGTGRIERSGIMEFLNLRQQVSTMINLTLKKMFDLPIDVDLQTKLTKKFDYENAINNPEVDRLKLNGPRMGFTFLTGEISKIVQAPIEEGGFDAFPLFFQFGYQFEVQYLNSGNFQALFEFIPVVTGLDQGKFFPSINILNGLRNNRTGLEFAFGPQVSISKQARGFYGKDGEWYLRSQTTQDGFDQPIPDSFEYRLDNRGEYRVASSFLFAVGKTFRSGNLNIPVNFFFVPNQDGSRMGISVGFNTNR